MLTRSNVFFFSIYSISIVKKKVTLNFQLIHNFTTKKKFLPKESKIKIISKKGKKMHYNLKKKGNKRKFV
jgi:ribosome-associated toxin RatA of RatAB toxin-antitoxin module